MLNKPLLICTALIALGIAACGGGASGPALPFPNAGQNTTAVPITLTPVSGYSGTLTVQGSDPQATSSPASITAMLSTGAPSGITPLAIKKQDVATPSPVIYITLTAGSGGALITGVTNIQLAMASPAPSGQSYYFAYFNGTIWKTLGPAGSLVSGTTATYTFTGGSISPSVTLGAGQSLYLGVYSGTYSIPSPTPSPTPTATPTSTPVQAITNGDFETGSLSGWYVCYAAHPTLLSPTDDSPPIETPQPTFTQSPTTPSQTTQAPATDAVVVGTTPIPGPSSSPVATTFVPHAGSYAAQIGFTTQPRKKGLIGLCQDITVPALGAQLGLWVWEGGNVAAFTTADTEVDLFQGATWTTTTPSGGKLTTSNPTATYFAEENCYNNTDTSGGTSTFGSCATPSPAQPPNSHGGQWRHKGPYDLSAYAGKSVTVMVGLWSSSTSTGYYDYMFVDDVSLSGFAPSGPTPTPAPTASVPITIQAIHGGGR